MMIVATAASSVMIMVDERYFHKTVFVPINTRTMMYLHKHKDTHTIPIDTFYVIAIFLVSTTK